MVLIDSLHELSMRTSRSLQRVSVLLVIQCATLCTTSKSLDLTTEYRVELTSNLMMYVDILAHLML